METDIEKQYYSLIASGELIEMFPGFSQEWKKDKKVFTKFYEDNQKVLKDNYLDLEQEDNDDIDDSRNY